jgi:hypothetical protein
MQQRTPYDGPDEWDPLAITTPTPTVAISSMSVSSSSQLLPTSSHMAMSSMMKTNKYGAYANDSSPGMVYERYDDPSTSPDDSHDHASSTVNDVTIAIATAAAATEVRQTISSSHTFNVAIHQQREQK